MTDKNTVLEKKFISAVVYLRNDAGRIESFAEKLTEFLSSNFADYEIIFANDASTDDSIPVIKSLCARDSRMRAVSIVQMGHFQGQESAMNAGRDLAIGDFVYEFDDISWTMTGILCCRFIIKRSRDMISFLQAVRMP